MTLAQFMAAAITSGTGATANLPSSGPAATATSVTTVGLVWVARYAGGSTTFIVANDQGAALCLAAREARTRGHVVGVELAAVDR